MFGWFRATCPVDPVAKAWIEERLTWLDQQFKRSAFSGRPVILPTHEFFPDPYDGSRRSVRMLFNRVCGYMRVSPDMYELKFFAAKTTGLEIVNESGHALPTEAAGTYQEGEAQFIIRIEKSGVEDPMGLVGTIAHEISHSRLLGESRIGHDAFDNELLTDLCAVFHGFGIFLANSPRHWDGMYGNWPGTGLKKPEYMTSLMYGYALAHLAWFRNEPSPAWARHLRLGPRANFKQGLRYLLQTGDSVFRPLRLREDAEA